MEHQENTATSKRQQLLQLLDSLASYVILSIQWFDKKSIDTPIIHINDNTTSIIIDIGHNSGSISLQL